MSQDKIKETEAPALGRRRFLNTAAIASIGTLVACNEKPGTAGGDPLCFRLSWWQSCE